MKGVEYKCCPEWRSLEEPRAGEYEPGMREMGSALFGQAEIALPSKGDQTGDLKFKTCIIRVVMREGHYGTDDASDEAGHMPPNVSRGLSNEKRG